MLLRCKLVLCTLLTILILTTHTVAINPVPAQTGNLSLEVFQVADLPLHVHEATLEKVDKNYRLKCWLSNNAEVKIIGLRYSVVAIDSKNEIHIVINRSEGLSLAAYDSRAITFRTPLAFKPRDGFRLMMMLEQVVSSGSIWEVVKAKDAAAAYAIGDYSTTPQVLHVPNQVDAPLPTRLPF